MHNFDKNKLKHPEEIDKKDEKTENPFLNEINNFDRNKLKHHEESNNVKQSDPTLDSLREIMEKRRADIESDMYEEEEPDWDD